MSDLPKMIPLDSETLDLIEAVSTVVMSDEVLGYRIVMVKRCWNREPGEEGVCVVTCWLS